MSEAVGPNGLVKKFWVRSEDPNVFKPVVSAVLSGAVFASVLVSPAGAQSTDGLCAGLEPTIIGSEGDDVIHGTFRDDVILALGGNDEIRGASGADVICGGSGNDVIYGDSQNDVIFGGPGDDIIHGGSDHDEIHGGDGNDELYGNCLLYTSPSPRDKRQSRMPSSA